MEPKTALPLLKGGHGRFFGLLDLHGLLLAARCLSVCRVQGGARSQRDAHQEGQGTDPRGHHLLRFMRE